MSKHKNKLISLLVIVILLGISFFVGEDAHKKSDVPASNVITDKLEKTVTEAKPIATKKDNAKKEKQKEEISASKPSDEVSEEATEQVKETEEETDAVDDVTLHHNDPEKAESKQEVKQEERPKPVDPDEAVISAERLTCTLSVRCDTAIGKNSDKSEIIPKDGIILKEKEVTFYRGESVFNVLLREMKLNKIHMEFVSVPLYNSAYIEGIANLYEFDCGELSGWMYKVNDWFPNYGSSRYVLNEGDKVEIIYTCDLGKDIGGEYSPRNGR